MPQIASEWRNSLATPKAGRPGIAWQSGGSTARNASNEKAWCNGRRQNDTADQLRKSGNRLNSLSFFPTLVFGSPAATPCDAAEITSRPPPKVDGTRVPDPMAVSPLDCLDESSLRSGRSYRAGLRPHRSGRDREGAGAGSARNQSRGECKSHDHFVASCW
jgi:hypothetical protein